MKKYLAEAVGTFCLVFMGTGAIIVDHVSHGQVTSLGVSFVFGLVVLAMIYAVGHISGAHFNPAVTAGFFAAGRLKGREVAPYIAAQLSGAVLASLALKSMFIATPSNLGMTLPCGSAGQAFMMEFILTAVLMFVVMGVATGAREEGILAGVAIGATIALEAMVGGPISGASMNPARSFAPALVTGHFTFLWVYWVAPISGSIMGAKLYQRIS